MDNNTNYSIFKDTALQETFNKEGFVVLSLFDQDIIEKLHELFCENYQPNDNHTYALSAEIEPENNELIAAKLIRQLNPYFDKVLKDYMNHGGTFFAKTKQHSELRLHQDTTVIDYTKGMGCYTWIPLQDVKEHNGCLFIIPKSHRFFNNIVSFDYSNNGIDRDAKLNKYVQKVEMKAGDILFFSGSLFHGSYNCQSEGVRVAVNVAITHKDTPFVYYKKNNEALASEYIVSPSAYRTSFKRYSAGLLPDGAIFKRNLPYSHIKIDGEMLKQKCIENDMNYGKTNMIKSMVKWFKQVFYT